MNRLNPCIILANKMAIPLAFSMYLVPTPNIDSRTHTFVFGHVLITQILCWSKQLSVVMPHLKSLIKSKVLNPNWQKAGQLYTVFTSVVGDATYSYWNFCWTTPAGGQRGGEDRVAWPGIDG